MESILTIVEAVPVRDVERYGYIQCDRLILVPATKTSVSEPRTHVTPLGGVSPLAPSAGWTDSGSGPLSVLILLADRHLLLDIDLLRDIDERGVKGILDV